MIGAGFRFFLRRLVLGLALAFALLLVYLFLPLPPSLVWTMPASKPSYADAVARFEQIIAATPASVRLDCRPQMLVHGHPTEKVFVFLHGLSNAPVQFTPLAKLLFDRGYNVIIPRLPYHGEKDRLNTEWGRLTAQEMIDSGNEAVDIAQGLGTKVIVAGLSINGTTAAWMAQNREDVDRAVIMAPFFAPKGLPGWAVTPMTKVILSLPNFFIWWDPRYRENLPGPEYVYPRFPTHIIGQTMLLGQETIAQAHRFAPKARSILVVTSASDIAVNAHITDRLVESWRRLRPEGVETYLFPLEEKVPHDFIDPNQTNQQVDLVYPRLIDLLLR